jgi:hypothetical protein
MARWLVVVSADTDLEELRNHLAARGSMVDDQSPIPLDGNEQVLLVEGPRDLPARVADIEDLIHKVSPDSEMELY